MVCAHIHHQGFAVDERREQKIFSGENFSECAMNKLVSKFLNF